MFLCCCLLQICLLTYLSADETYWDSNLVRAYVHNSDMQRRWAWAFLGSKLRHLKGDERILDMGCGDGKITADISKVVPDGSVKGVDPSTPMLNWARKQYCASEYPNLSFYEGGFLEPNQTEAFDIIFSNCALQHCSDQASAFSNMARLLKPEGKLWLSIPTIDNAAWKVARKNIQSSPKWASYWQNISPRIFLQVDEYVTLLRQAGLQSVRIEKIQTIDPFVDREELINFLLGTFIPAVPAAMAREFYNEWMDEYIRLLPEAAHANGVIEIRLGRIEIEATRLQE